MKLSTQLKRAVIVQRDQLNRLIHTQNLYHKWSRFIDARVENGKVTVENLQTGERVPFEGEGWRTGSGAAVNIGNLHYV